jgi:hypothetical protein
MITNGITYRAQLTLVANKTQPEVSVSYCSVTFNSQLEYAFLQSSKDFIK